MPRLKPAELMHEQFSKINPNAKKHEIQRLDINHQAMLTKPVGEGTLDIKGTIASMKKERIKPWQFWKERSINGSNIDVDLHLDKVLYPIMEHIKENPQAVDAAFKNNLTSVIDILEKKRGGSLTTLAFGKRANPDSVYSKDCHELIHQHIEDYIKNAISTETLEGSRTHEGMASYLELHWSGIHNGKSFANAIKQFEGKEHNERYAEPAKMLHEMISKSEIISKDSVDHNKLVSILEQMKQGKTVDQIYQKFKGN